MPSCNFSRNLGLKILVLAFAFACGLAVAHYQLPPFQLIQAIKNSLTSFLAPQGLDQPFEGSRSDPYSYPHELLKYAFTDPVIEGNLYHKKIENFEGLLDRNEEILVPTLGFKSAFRRIELVGVEQVAQSVSEKPVIKVTFTYNRKKFESFAYGTLPSRCGQGAHLGIMALVGSGLNVSSATFTGEASATYGYIVGERSLYKATENLKSDIYVFIKPNEDFLAWHNGSGRKVNINFIVPWHLNRGASYSVSHLVQSMAFVKWMKTCYRRTVIAGLSSGGAAALTVSLQANPSVAIISSGYSVINNYAKWSSITGIMGVPGQGELDDENVIREKLIESESQFLFTWGKEEIGAYGIEARELTTARTIGEIPNVHYIVHQGGHVFPVAEIREFISELGLDDS